MKRRRRNTEEAQATPEATPEAAPAALPDPTSKYHLLNLPGEIKNAIYEYCIQGEITVEISTTQRINSIRDWPRNWRLTTFEGHPEEKEGDVREFALFKTCRQIRYETLPILAKLGHTCLYVDVLGAFKVELVDMLPVAYTANIREIRLWKYVTSLKSQTLTTALPQLEKIVLDYTTQALADVVERKGPWARAWLRSNGHGPVKELVTRLYKRERNNLTKSDPDRQVTLSIRVPFGRFKVTLAIPTNTRVAGFQPVDVAGDYSIVS